MKELIIPRELMKLVLKKSVSAPSDITVNYLHFALVSMETERIFDNFKVKGVQKNDDTFNRYLFLSFNLNWYAFYIYYTGNQYHSMTSN